MPQIRSRAVPLALAILVIGMHPTLVLGASSSIECGQLSSYTAPDPAGPTDGSLQIGLLAPWIVLATAIVSPTAATALPLLAGSGPTCLAIDFDDFGAITAIDIAPAGTIRGSLAFDSGSGFYILADRLIIPTFVTDAYPGLAAIVVTSYQAGTDLDIDFTVDPSIGQLSGFDGLAAFCGRGRLTSGGDGRVGDAVIPAAVLDTADRAALQGAGTRRTCAVVHSVGTVDLSSGALSITTDVDIRVAAAAIGTAPPTSTTPAIASGSRPWLPIVPLLFAAVAGAFAISIRRSSRDPRA